MKTKLAVTSPSQKEIRKEPYDFPTFRPEFPTYKMNLETFGSATLAALTTSFKQISPFKATSSIKQNQITFQGV